VTTTVTNVTECRCPLEWAFTLPRGDDSNIEGALLEIPAKSYIAVDDRQLPTGEILPLAGNPLDFSTRKSVSGHDIDMTYTDLIRDDSGSRWRPSRTHTGTG